jgi:hypothetical protein
VARRLNTPNADAKPKKLSSKDAEGIVKLARDGIEESYEAEKINREEAASDLNFLAGNQWPDEVKSEREREGRPMLTINRLPQFVRQITNDIRQADIAIKVRPEDDETDPELAKIYDGLIRQIQYRSSAKHVYSQAAEHQASCGIGWFRVSTDYADDTAFNQEIKIKGIKNPLSVYWDPASVEPDRSDAMWIAVTEMIPKTSFKSRWPKAKEVDVELPSNIMESRPFFWSTDETVRVAEYWRKVAVTKRLALFEDGSTVDITEFNEFQRQMLPPIKMERDCDTYKVEMYRVSGAEVLDGPHEWAGKWIPLIPVIGGEFPLEEKTYRYSAIRFTREPQQLYNYYRTAHAEMLALQPKAPYLVTTTMLGDPDVKKLWDISGKKNLPYLPYVPDPDSPNASPKREAPPQPSVAMVNEGQLAQDDMKATSGVYDSAMGAKSNETSGVAIGRREDQSDTANYHFIDNLQRSLEHTGRILIDLIPKIYDNERVVRLMPEHGGEGEEEAVSINKMVMSMDGQPMMLHDLSAASFDIRVTIGKAYATRRMEAADGLFQFAKALQPQHQAVIADLIAKNIDIPEADEMAKRLRRMVPPEVLNDPDDPNAPPQQPNPQAQAAQMAAQMELQKMELENQKVQAEIARADAQLQTQIAKGQADIALGEQKLELERQKAELDMAIEAQKLQLERERHDIERQKMHHDAQMAEVSARQQDDKANRDFTLAQQDRADRKAAEKSKASPGA